MERPSFALYATYQTEDFLLDEYFQYWVQQGDPESVKFWQAFLQAYPEKKESLHEAYDVASQIRYRKLSLSEKRQKEILENVYARDKRSFSGWAGLSHRINWPLAMAAAISLLMISFLVLQFYEGQSQVYQTDSLENKTFLLPDGSEVVLNANTRLRVAIDVAEDQPREVWLEGEAFFEVRKLSTAEYEEKPALRKFIVHTANFDIEVLGTSFNVSSTAQKSEIMLKTGKVKVASQQINETEMLEPGDRLSLAEQENNFYITKEDVSVKPAWRENLFIFDNTPLCEVARSVEQYHGLQMEFADEAISSKLFTAKLSRDELPTLLKAIEESFDVSAVQQGKVITIAARNP